MLWDPMNPEKKGKLPTENDLKSDSLVANMLEKAEHDGFFLGHVRAMKEAQKIVKNAAITPQQKKSISQRLLDEELQMQGGTAKIKQSSGKEGKQSLSRRLMEESGV